MKPKNLGRRQFLTAAIGWTAGAAAAPLLAPRAFGGWSARALALSPRRDRVLVLVDLSGGNDGLNTVVPYGVDRYHALRPTLRFDKSRLLPIHEHQGEQLGLRQELRGLKEIYDQGKMSIVQGVGYPGPDRSHFRSSDIWHTASLTPETVRTGWIGRLAECDGIAAPTRTPALMVGNDKVPLLLHGARGPAPQVESLERLKLPLGPQGTMGSGEAGTAALAEAMRSLAKNEKAAGASPDASIGFLRDAARSIHESTAQVERAAERGRAGAGYSDTRLGSSLKLAAQLLLGGLDCSAYYVRQDGYDTHAFQAETHALLLQELGDSLAAFWSDVEKGGAAKRVTVLVWSEFGRRAAENGSKGTDHGAAAPAFLIGGEVRGGLVGAHPSLEPRDLDPEQDVKFGIDFRRIYATLVEDWLAVPAASVLPEKLEPLPLLRRAV